MSEQKESSVLFSLKELMNLEEDRIRGEEADKAARTAAEDEARRAAERAARDAEEARIRAEEERRRAEEQRGREENARLDAIRHAEVEKARLEAEQQARMQAMSAQQQHALQIEALKTDKGKKQLRNILIGTVVAVLTIGGAGIYLAVDASKKADAEKARLEADARSKQEEIDRLNKKAEEANAKVGNLESAVANEKDQRKKAELQAQLNAAKAEAEEADKAAGRPATGGGGFKAKPGAGGDDAPKAKTVCTCKATDPLCDCL
ncbi:MAG: hypothetical protein HOW73_30290 [Polyangiaceae bacterium]|nr:hypothetical protein [Polyangiaceae bacterium]